MATPADSFPETALPPLPQLPQVRAPEHVNDIEADAVYVSAQELWRLVNDPSGEATIRALLKDEHTGGPKMAAALAQVLHEAAILKQRGSDGGVEAVPQPSGAPPPLPPGSSWIGRK